MRKGLKDRELSSIFGGIGFAQDEGGNDEGATDGEEDDENALPRGEREDDAAQNGGENRGDAVDGADDCHDFCEAFSGIEIGGDATREDDAPRGADTLEEPHGDENPDIAGEDATCRCDDKGDKREDKGWFSTEFIA